MPHVIYSTDHIKMNVCKVTHSIMFVTCGTGLTASIPRLDAVQLFQF